MSEIVEFGGDIERDIENLYSEAVAELFNSSIYADNREGVIGEFDIKFLENAMDVICSLSNEDLSKYKCASDYIEKYN
jgi:hypothetical protein